MYKARCLIKMPSAYLFKVNVYVILSGRMSGATHVTIHHYSNYDTEYKKLKTAYKFSI